MRVSSRVARDKGYTSVGILQTAKSTCYGARNSVALKRSYWRMHVSRSEYLQFVLGALRSVRYGNSHNLSGCGLQVEVSCEVLAPSLPGVSPDGYGYWIASQTWDTTFYAIANNFLNGDILGQRPYTHNTSHLPAGHACGVGGAGSHRQSGPSGFVQALSAGDHRNCLDDDLARGAG